MFDFVHENKKLGANRTAVNCLVVCFLGYKFIPPIGNVEALATVNGTKISSQEFDKAMRGSRVNYVRR